jgi:V/A-type H+-transporting ATPase subunit C
MLRRMRVVEARKCLAGYPFSIGVVLAYLALLSEQLRDVRAILNAKYFGLADERLRSFL